MLESNLHTPQLCLMAHCDDELQFAPHSIWPQGLPAVAVNSLIFAGFSQEFVFNHQVDPQNSDRIAALFRSLYFELSFVETARLIEKSKKYDWFPISAVVQKFGWQPTEQFYKVAQEILKTPPNFQNWCFEKKVSPQDLLPLLSASGLETGFLFSDIPSLALSKSLGVKALELGIELLMMGLKPGKISSQQNQATSPLKNSYKGEMWIEALKQLRYPETFKQDQKESEKMTALPWPGSSQAKWIRQGDRAGIELKLFVTQPSDLKKYLQSLNRVHDLLEKDSLNTKH